MHPGMPMHSGMPIPPGMQGPIDPHLVTQADLRAPLEIERVIQEERHRSMHTKEVLMKQVDGFMKKDMESASILRDMEVRFHETQNENENLKRENSKLREDYLKNRDELMMKESRMEEHLRSISINFTIKASNFNFWKKTKR